MSSNADDDYKKAIRELSQSKEIEFCVSELKKIGDLEPIIKALRNITSYDDNKMEELYIKSKEREDLVDRENFQAVMKIFPALLAILSGESGVEYSPMEQTNKLSPKVPMQPPPLDNAGRLTTPNSPYTAHAARAIVAAGKQTKKQRWYKNSINEAPQFQEAKTSWHGGSMTTYLEFSKQSAAALWERVRAMDAITLDVYLWVCALLCEANLKNKDSSATLHPEQMMLLKRFERRGHDRRVMERRILDAARTLSGLRTDIVNIPITYTGTGANRKPTEQRVTIRNCALFHLDGIVYLEQGELFTDKPEEYPDDEKEILAIHIIAGKWARHWMNTNAEKGTVNWTSKANRSLLEFGETRAELAAKRFGALLLTMPGGTDPFKREQAMTHADILEAIGEMPDDETLKKNRKAHWGTRVEQVLYGAEDDNGRWTPGLFDLLKEAGILANYEKPLDIEAGDRGRGWVERWLALEVRWTTTEAAKKIEQAILNKQNAEKENKTRKAYKRRPNHDKPRKPLTKAQRLDIQMAANIRAKCARLNWNRDVAARHFGVSGATLSNVLSLRYAPGTDWAHKLQDFLDNYPEPE